MLLFVRDILFVINISEKNKIYEKINRKLYSYLEILFLYVILVSSSNDSDFGKRR